MRRRFYVESFAGNSAILRGDAAHHLGRVLRAEPGQLYELSDGRAVWLGRIERVRREAVEFVLIEPVPAREPAVRVDLLLSIIKFDRFEWVLEKATELGVADIVPLAAARSDKSLVAAAAKRARRWEKILLESAQQARRLRPPALLPLARPAELFSKKAAQQGAPLRPADLKIVLSERPLAPSLCGVLGGKSVASAVLAIGPEGGWTESELAAAGDAGFQEASLGERILRTETAGIAALAVLNYALGESDRMV